MIVSVWLQGLGLGASLIIAIGAQNAFVLRQGLARRFTFMVALVCTLCDATLILIGVGGLGSIIAQSWLLTMIATWGGILFLGWYGWRSFAAARTTHGLAAVNQTPPQRRSNILAQTLAVSLLNPHVYLDTIVLVGSVGAHYPGQDHAWFALGAMSASAVWFFGVAYGAARLAPLFRQPLTWQILDITIGIIMWAIAASLFWSALHMPRS